MPLKVEGRSAIFATTATILIIKDEWLCSGRNWMQPAGASDAHPGMGIAEGGRFGRNVWRYELLDVAGTVARG